MKMPLAVSATLLACALLMAAQEDSATVSGIVVNHAGEPVPDAAVVLRPADLAAVVRDRGQTAAVQSLRSRSKDGRSNAEGRFTFTGIQPGLYLYGAVHNDYVEFVSREDIPEAPSNLTLTAGQNLTRLVITLDPGATVTGRVVDRDGDPLPRAKVEVLRPIYSNGHRRFATVGIATTGDNGEFEVTKIPPGPHYVRAGPATPNSPNERVPIPAVKPGEKDIRPFGVFYGNTTEFEEAPLIDLTSGQRYSVGNLTMPDKPYIHVRGKVIGDPTALTGARVVRMGWTPSHAPDWTGGADIHPDGSFDNGNLWSGAFTLGVYKRDGSLLLGWTPITTTEEDAQGVVINAAAAPLRGAIRIGGDLPDGAIRPRGALLLTAAEGPGVITARAQLTPEGAFQIPLLAPGKYIANLLQLPPGWYIKSMHLEGREALDNGLDFAGAGANLDILLSPRAATVEGTVVDQEGKPLKGFVTLVPETPRFGHARLYPATISSANGAFLIESITPGRYRIYAWENIPDTAHWDEAYIQPFRANGQLIELAESERLQVKVNRISESTMRQELSRAGL